MSQFPIQSNGQNYFFLSTRVDKPRYTPSQQDHIRYTQQPPKLVVATKVPIERLTLGRRKPITPNYMWFFYPKNSVRICPICVLFKSMTSKVGLLWNIMLSLVASPTSPKLTTSKQASHHIHDYKAYKHYIYSILYTHRSV